MNNNKNYCSSLKSLQKFPAQEIPKIEKDLEFEKIARIKNSGGLNPNFDNAGSPSNKQTAQGKSSGICSNSNYPSSNKALSKNIQTQSQPKLEFNPSSTLLSSAGLPYNRQYITSQPLHNHQTSHLLKNMK